MSVHQKTSMNSNYLLCCCFFLLALLALVGTKALVEIRRGPKDRADG